MYTICLKWAIGNSVVQTSPTHILKGAATIKEKQNQKNQKKSINIKSLSHCKEQHANKLHINETEGQVTEQL